MIELKDISLKNKIIIGIWFAILIACVIIIIVIAAMVSNKNNLPLSQMFGTNTAYIFYMTPMESIINWSTVGIAAILLIGGVVVGGYNAAKD